MPEKLAEQNRSLDLLIQGCLKSLQISLLAEWDVLIFLYRHHASLASADQIARLLGYPSTVVGDALDRLTSQGLVHRSRFSQGVRFYQFALSEAHAAPESCVRQLLSLAENRSGRLRVIKHLRPSASLHIAAKGKPK